MFSTVPGSDDMTRLTISQVKESKITRKCRKSDVIRPTLLGKPIKRTTALLIITVMLWNIVAQKWQ